MISIGVVFLFAGAHLTLQLCRNYVKLNNEHVIASTSTDTVEAAGATGQARFIRQLLVWNWIGLILLLAGGATVLALARKPKTPDPDRCASCGYSLLGLPSDRCPECGARFDAAIRRKLSKHETGESTDA